MKPSMYNFIWPTDDPGKVMVFNSLTTFLAEVENTHIDLLNLPQFDYDSLPADTKQFIDGLKQGGFVLDDEADELKILKFAYNSNKYNRLGIGFTIAPTLRCNFACTYCYEQWDGALKLLDILEENNLKDIAIHLGHVSADTAGCKSIESSCTTMEEFTVLNQTFHETLRQRGFKTGQLPHYPRIAHACGANRMNAFVLDPDGDMYKCWSEIGDKPARIGNIVDFKQNI